MGWTIFLLGAATLLVVFATQRNKSGSLLGVIGLGGMLFATIGAGIQGALLPAAIVATITCCILIVAAIFTNKNKDRPASIACLGLAVGSGAIAIVAFIISLTAAEPREDPQILFDPASIQAEQRAVLDLARLDLELLLQRDIPARELAVRQEKNWKLLEAIALFRNRVVEIRAQVDGAIAQLEQSTGTPLPEAEVDQLLKEVAQALETLRK